MVLKVIFRRELLTWPTARLRNPADTSAPVESTTLVWRMELSTMRVSKCLRSPGPGGGPFLKSSQRNLPPPGARKRLAS